MPNLLDEVTLRQAWQTELTPLICEQCDWRYLAPPGSTPAYCPHCFSDELLPLSEFAEDLPYDRPPELVLPFSVAEAAVRQRIETFARDIWFAPADLNVETLGKRLKRLYLPMWLVDSQVTATWQAEVGFNYEVVTHRDKFDENRQGWSSQQVTETRVRWEPRVGRLQRHYENVIAPALEEHNALPGRLGDYDLQPAQPYQAETVQSTFLRLPNRAPADAWPEALPTLQQLAGEECHQACQSDHFREFRWNPAYTGQNWTLLLLPLYSTYYLDDDKQPQPILIHGQNGRLSGRRQASMQRARRASLIIAGVAVAIFLVSVVLALASLAFTRLLAVAGLVLLVALGVGVLGLLPMLVVWQFNRTN